MLVAWLGALILASRSRRAITSSAFLSIELDDPVRRAMTSSAFRLSSSGWRRGDRGNVAPGPAWGGGTGAPSAKEPRRAEMGVMTETVSEEDEAELGSEAEGSEQALEGVSARTRARGRYELDNVVDAVGPGSCRGRLGARGGARLSGLAGRRGSGCTGIPVSSSQATRRADQEESKVGRGYHFALRCVWITFSAFRRSGQKDDHLGRGAIEQVIMSVQVGLIS